MGKKLSAITRKLSIPTIISVSAITDPSLAALLTFLFGISGLVAEWQQNRAREIVDNVGIETILNLIERDNKSRDILHRILINLMDESSKRKRGLYYNYIKNIHTGKKPDFDYHSKIINIVDMITFQELEVMRIFKTKYEDIFKYFSKKNNTEFSSYNQKGGITVRGILESNIFDEIKTEEITDKYLADSLNRLFNYGLISTGLGALGGTAYGPLTEFGECFYDFIFPEKSS